VLAGADFVARHCGAGAGDGHVLKTAVNFTSVLRQVGWPLLTGGWADVLPASAGQDLTVLSRALTVHPITMCSFFPSTLNAMLAAGLPIGDSLRHLMFGGEPLPGELVRRAAGATGAELHNVYGMTECNLALWLRCPPDAEFEVAPLGEPVDGLTVTVDESAGHGEGVPGGAGPAPGATAPASVGELVVAGTHVALGYAGQPELTAERFDVTDDGQRRFRTRDLVVPDTGGSTRSALRYAGRVDDRVKVRGYAVELGAVEQILRRHPAVLDCVVGVRDLGLSDQRLESFVVTGPIPVSVNELRGHLRRELPDYLVPTVLRLVAELPRLNNGKVDRRGLFAGPGPDTDLTDSDQPMASVVMPSDVVVEADRPGPDWIDQARQLYAEALQTSPDKVDDTLDFFDLGGHSLLVLRLVTLIEDRLGVIIEMDEALAAPTARQLAGLLAERASGPPGTTPEAG
ncbi:MAG TPA: non-ribosomal peptide synthetase, partial [Micromonospora sp.]